MSDDLKIFKPKISNVESINGELRFVLSGDNDYGFDKSSNFLFTNFSGEFNGQTNVNINLNLSDCFSKFLYIKMFFINSSKQTFLPRGPPLIAACNTISISLLQK